jgi:hypothetical protein
LEIFNKSLHDEILHNWTRPNGCKDQVKACQAELEGQGPVFLSFEEKNVSQVCAGVEPECAGLPAAELYQEIVPGAGWYDVAHPKADPFPPPYMYGYLTESTVLAALGVPVNFSESSKAVAMTFQGTFDIIHGGFLQSIGYLLDSGVKVHMMYGDRDYPCNWVGGEAASLAVPYSKTEAFAAAGYAPLFTPDGVQGMTRQVGNFSFTRVFQAVYAILKKKTFSLQ